jgi:O-antigen ligase
MQEDRLARWSRYLIYVILAVLPLERIPSWDVASVTIRLSQVAGLILIAINLPLMWRSRGQLLRNPWRWLAAFWLVCLLSAGLAENLKRSVSVTVFTVFVGLLAWVIALRFEKSRLRTYLSIIVVSALTTCAFGYYQFFGDLLGLPVDVTGLRPQYTKDVFGFPRIQSTGLEPLYFGNYLLIPSALLIGAMVYRYRRRLAAILAAPVFAVIWLTVSRGAMVALMAIILIAAGYCVWKRQWKPLGTLTASTVVSGLLAMGLLYLGTHYVVKEQTQQSAQAIQSFSKQTTNISNGESAEGRTITRNLALDAFKSDPVLGIGPGNFGTYASRHMPSRFDDPNVIVNNEPLEVLAETGLLGLGSLVVFFVLLLVNSVKLLKSSLASEQQLWLAGLAAALFAIALQYQTFSTLYITHIWAAVGLLAGLTYSLAPKRK